MLKFLIELLKLENLVVGIALTSIGVVVLCYVTLYKRMITRYLIIIPSFTIFWGITSIVIGFDGSSSIFEDTTVSQKLNAMIHLYSINIVHWTFVIKYYKTSKMLPKIFHEIMIDDFIEGGKLYRQDSKRLAIDDELSLLEASAFIDLSMLDDNNLKIDTAQLNRIIKDHQ